MSNWRPNTNAPKVPAAVLRKGAIPAALLAALTSPLAYQMLERWEANILHVYADKLAGGLPTWCAGRTGWDAKVGTRLSSDQCAAVNKVTLLEYGYAVLGCANWDYLTAQRLVSLTMFAINVGKDAACGSRAFWLINAGQVAEGCRALAYSPSGTPAWSYAGGKYVQGLANRRRAESALCAQGAST